MLDVFPGSPAETVVLGGSGFWAAVGVAATLDEESTAVMPGRPGRPAGVSIASRVGTDFGPYRPILHRLGIRTDALVTDGPQTSRTIITYPVGEERREEPVGGWPAHVRMRAVWTDVPEPVRAAPGCYVFRDWHPGFWEPLLEDVRRHRTQLLWELPASICTPADLPRLRAVLPSVAIVSLNLAEARALLGVGPDAGPAGELSAAEAARRIADLGARTVLLRAGRAGSVVAHEGRLLRVSAARVPAIDVTGAGNAFSGAFLGCRIAGADVASAATFASAVAAMVVSRLGPPDSHAAARAQALELVRTARVWDLGS
ncbi:hypothetical protein GCM10007977_098510 [Dactylosporangium sucinum]|uniref:Carbohydrate kinase PfkB domain-containing protein n=1 Tax=Dactylosporangium sucinum TaxID=1424081 RepID=A0A917UCI5_9ACTN|nr:hypothetical protein GCM10007977_098510 [Dactylosporangium sucinum]